MEALRDPAKTFDTSGKSAALIHHHAICKTPMALPDNGLFGAIAGRFRSSIPIRSGTSQSSGRQASRCQSSALLLGHRPTKPRMRIWREA
jgi:hypothetical protein